MAALVRVKGLGLALERMAAKAEGGTVPAAATANLRGDWRGQQADTLKQAAPELHGGGAENQSSGRCSRASAGRH